MAGRDHELPMSCLLLSTAAQVQQHSRENLRSNKELNASLKDGLHRKQALPRCLSFLVQSQPMQLLNGNALEIKTRARDPHKVALHGSAPKPPSVRVLPNRENIGSGTQA